MEFLTQFGYVVLGVWILAESIGLPLPAMPMLLAAGALAAKGPFQLWLALTVSVCSCLVSDLFWFGIGRRGNQKVLKFICRISLEPDSCVRRTTKLIEKYGAKSLLVSKFVPGLNAVAAPLAGSTGVPLRRFFVFDLMGSVIWCGTFLGAGYLFREKVTILADRLAQFKWQLAVTLLVIIPAAYIAFKFWQRRKFIREIWMERITPEELFQRIQAGEKVLVLDLRHPLDFLPDPRILPQAVRILPEELEQGLMEIPRGHEVVLYCT
ncbi:MAG TPA: VTT domain-containing protein [Candidatus Angelobacter sp.]